jgi:glycosyltransferase involved in cell wall biosynthesis
VVASAVGGLTDTVLDGVTGALIPPKDPEALVEAATPLLQDADFRQSVGRNGLRRARTRYAWPSIARETTDIYGEVVAERAGLLTEARNR